VTQRHSKGAGMTPEFHFARNLKAQEAQRWAEYLKHGTPAALHAWRDVRKQMLRERFE
jgi:hypothetical protein